MSAFDLLSLFALAHRTPSFSCKIYGVQAATHQAVDIDRPREGTQVSRSI